MYSPLEIQGLKNKIYRSGRTHAVSYIGRILPLFILSRRSKILLRTASIILRYSRSPLPVESSRPQFSVYEQGMSVHDSPHPIVITISILGSSDRGLRLLSVMSQLQYSKSIHATLSSKVCGVSDPAEYASKASDAYSLARASATRLLYELCRHRNATLGFFFS